MTRSYETGLTLPGWHTESAEQIKQKHGIKE